MSSSVSLEQRRGEKNDFPSLALVEAKTYAGDHSGAVQTAQSLSGLWKQICKRSAVSSQLSAFFSRLQRFDGTCEPRFQRAAEGKGHVGNVPHKASRLLTAERLQNFFG